MVTSGGGAENARKRKVRSDKKHPVLSKLDFDTHDKLVKLAISCGMTKTKLAEFLINICLNNPETVRSLQDRYNTNKNYYVTPVLVQDKIEYMFLD
ncbi:hypothetical protein ABE354_08810 [Brevibacillus laterosporus]|uniref:hypothetical protein n=1 Tax=Brevibacillus laterosporus TaxID=1465 RepID=UPI003D20FA63